MKKIIASYFILFSSIFSYGQDLFLKSKVSDSAIQFRFVPSTHTIFKEGSINGYSLKRLEWKNSQLPIESDWLNAETITESNFPTKENAGWKTEQSKGEYALTYSLAYDEKKMKPEEEKTLFGFVFITMDIHPELAEFCGFKIKDLNFSKAKSYAYRLEMKNAKYKSNVIILNSDDITPLLKINDWEVKSKNKTAEVKWNSKLHKSDFSYYIIERSTDSIHFGRINSVPLVPLVSQYEKDKTHQYFSDTTAQVDTYYFYRIYGVDHFGENSLASEIKKVYISSVFEGEVAIDTLFDKGEGEINLRFHLTKSSDKKIAAKYKIWVSNSINSKYNLLRELPAKSDSVVLHLKSKVNYVRVDAYTIADEFIQSWPELLLLPDRLPPSAPKGLMAEIDRNGKVTLNWNRNSENDVFGYRVFRTNAMHEEFVEITKGAISTTTLTDSLFLSSLTEEIYYSVNAVDSVFNNSLKSEPVKVAKPDYIAPEVSPIINFMATENGNVIRWTRSGSTDLLKIEIRRNLKEGNSEKAGEILASDSANYFTDTAIKNNTGYFYHTVSVDDANNFTESEKVYVFNDVFIKSIKDSLIYQVDREKKKITLNWIKPDEEVYSYSVYKAKKGENLRFFKELDGATSTLEDSQLYISNYYVYMVTATLKNREKLWWVERQKWSIE